MTPGGSVRPLASKICTVRRPGLRVESEVGEVGSAIGWVGGTDGEEDEALSLEASAEAAEAAAAAAAEAWLGLVMVPLECFVAALLPAVGAEDTDDDEEVPRVVSLSSKGTQQVSCNTD